MIEPSLTSALVSAVFCAKAPDVLNTPNAATNAPNITLCVVSSSVMCDGRCTFVPKRTRRIDASRSPRRQIFALMILHQPILVKDITRWIKLPAYSPIVYSILVSI